jgi:hypothetical protein
MHPLDIDVTLEAPDDTTFAAHSLGVAARLAAWPGMVCTGTRMDATSRTFSGRYLVTRRRRTRSTLERDLERLLRSSRSVATIRLDGRVLSSQAQGRASGAATPPNSSMFDTAPMRRVEHAAQA